MNYKLVRSLNQPIELKKTEEAADGTWIFGHFKVAKANLVAKIEDEIEMKRAHLRELRALKEKELDDIGPRAHGPQDEQGDGEEQEGTSL